MGERSVGSARASAGQARSRPAPPSEHSGRDLNAASRWYTELLGLPPYFTSEAAGGPGYVEFRIGDYQHELGIIDRRFAPPGLQANGGAIAYYQVEASLARLLALGATVLEPLTERGPGFVTASVIDPFGNVLGINCVGACGVSSRPRARPAPVRRPRPSSPARIMHNAHYLAVLEARHARD